MTWTPIAPRKASSLVGEAAVGVSGRKNLSLNIALRASAVPEQWRGG